MELAEITTLLGYGLGTALFLMLRGRGFWPAFVASLTGTVAVIGLVQLVMLETPLRVALVVILPLFLFAAFRLSGLLLILPALHAVLLGVARRRQVAAEARP